MDSNSKTIASTQHSLHEQLDKVVRKHLANSYNKPYAAHNVAAFKSVENILSKNKHSLIFDSYCGTGASTAALAHKFPDSFIIGIDKSTARLQKHSRDESVNNYLLIRAETEDFWRLAFENDIRLQRHFLLYPNPWPKSRHLTRRCHASPSFPSLLALGGNLILRSNWLIYLEEFSQALRIANVDSNIRGISPKPAITLFETKYQQSGHKLFELEATLR